MVFTEMLGVLEGRRSRAPWRWLAVDQSPIVIEMKCEPLSIYSATRKPGTLVEQLLFVLLLLTIATSPGTSIARTWDESYLYSDLSVRGTSIDVGTEVTRWGAYNPYTTAPEQPYPP